jgi:hypothetical protein
MTRMAEGAVTDRAPAAMIAGAIPLIRFGDYALWFASKSYQHMANEAALPDAVVAPGARATARW